VTLEELREYVASNEYGAELALQHAMRLMAVMERELDELRAIFPAICEAIGNGSACSSASSVEFLREVPEEVRLVVTRLRLDLAGERALADRLAAVLRLYDADMLAGESMTWVHEHDRSLAAWKDVRK